VQAKGQAILLVILPILLKPKSQVIYRTSGILRNALAISCLMRV
jgi:hypothetical protein